MSENTQFPASTRIIFGYLCTCSLEVITGSFRQVSGLSTDYVSLSLETVLYISVSVSLFMQCNCTLCSHLNYPLGIIINSVSDNKYFPVVYFSILADIIFFTFYSIINFDIGSFRIFYLLIMLNLVYLCVVTKQNFTCSMNYLTHPFWRIHLKGVI